MSQTAQASLFPAKQPAAQGLWSLPSGWEWVPIEALGTIVGGGTPSKLKREYWSGTIPWVSPKDMKSLEITNTQDYVSELGIERSATKLLPPGTVLIVFRSGILAHTLPVAVASRPLTVNQDLKAIIPHKRFDSKYIVYALTARAQSILSRCVKKGATVHSLEGSRFWSEQVSIPFPKDTSRSLDIQRRIVARIEALLSELKEMRALVAAIRRDTDRLLAAAVHEVFTSLHSVADIVPLEKVATTFNGRASGEGNSTVRVFKTKHVYPHCLRLDRPSFMNAEQVKQLPRDRYLKPGDVLMANIAEGTLGRVSYVHECEESWTVDTQIMILRSLDDRNLLLGKWLYYYLWSERGQQEILARRSGIAFADKRGQTHIYPKNVLEIPVPVPPIEKQIQAVALLDNIQTEAEEMRRLQTQDAELLDQLEQSILERVFQGEL